MAATARDERSIAATKAQVLQLEGLRLVTGGNYRAATRAYRRAVELARRCDPPELLLLATVLNDFGVLCKFTGNFASAERMYRQALKLVPRQGSDRAEFLATLYHNLGGLEHARGRYVRGLGVRAARRCASKEASAAQPPGDCCGRGRACGHPGRHGASRRGQRDLPARSSVLQPCARWPAL